MESKKINLPKITFLVVHGADRVLLDSDLKHMINHFVGSIRIERQFVVLSAIHSIKLKMG